MVNSSPITIYQYIVVATAAAVAGPGGRLARSILVHV